MARPDLPALIPARLLDRGDGEVQVGSHHATAVVVAGLSAADREVLSLLDGTRTRHQLGAAYLHHDEDPARIDHLLQTLADHGLLRSMAPPRDLWSRPQAPAPTVLVAGRGDLADELARHLARAGCTVHTQHDLAPSRFPQAGRRSRTSPPEGLVVLVADGAVDPMVARRWAPWARVLPVVVTEGAITVGPLWSDLTDPCPLCLDLYRSDRDPAWPRVLAQLVDPENRAPRAAVGDPATTALACGVTLRLASGTERATTAGVTVEIDPTSGELVRRGWQVHPRCDAHLPAQEVLAG
ncbi:hypothetical protein [Arsenicicoccus dermatophilus]|uniref:hypothetical protein n=1 Tax=Arsenicicoccus dermatophilus TaxID=1076331 RepID=UPI0039173542